MTAVTLTPVLMESILATAEALLTTPVPADPAERVTWFRKAMIATEGLDLIETRANGDDDVAFEFWHANRSRFNTLAAGFDAVLVSIGAGAPEA